MALTTTALNHQNAQQLRRSTANTFSNQPLSVGSTMFDAQVQEISAGKVLKFSIVKESENLSYRQVLNALANDSGFRQFVARLIRNCPFEAVRWETPAVTTSTLDRNFEFVLLNSPSLHRTPDHHSFASFFQSATESGESSTAVRFTNLGGDAVLVAPLPAADYPRGFDHLSTFLRHGSEAQIDSLWREVGLAMNDSMGDQPVWLNTAGMGVAWLHVRLDSRPKYYGYNPYRIFNEDSGGKAESEIEY